MELTSTAFTHNGKIPAKYTCDGDRLLSPPLAWSGVPEGVKSFALLMDDPDIPELKKKEYGLAAFDHWTLFNIPADAREIGEGKSLGVVGSTSRGEQHYTGPCPPSEFEPSEHRYIFKLYALSEMLALPAGSTKKDVLDALASHHLAEAELIGRYSRK